MGGVDMQRATETEDTAFGKQVIIPMPRECSVVVLAANYGRGLKPYALKLSHQVYLERLEQAASGMPTGVGVMAEIVAIPASSENYIKLVENGKVIARSSK